MANKQFNSLSDLYVFLLKCQDVYLIDVTWPSTMSESVKNLENPILVEQLLWHKNPEYPFLDNVLLKGKSFNGKYFSWRFKQDHLVELEVKVHIPLSTQGKAQKKYKLFLNELKRKQ